MSRTFENILVTKNYREHQHIALIQLNRPKVLNALSTDLMRELVEALFLLEDDKDVRVIILTGNDRAFAAGADIGQLAEATSIDQINDTRIRTWKQLALISKPVIAAINGFALGAGCELAMSCDFIVAGDSARFGQPEIKIGTIPGAGGTQRLTKAIGKSKAMLAVLTGEMMDAYEAERSGLVAKVVPAETLMQETFEIAKVISNRAPVAVKLAKEAVNMAFETSLKDGMEFERRNFYLTFSSKDQKEGMKAFIEKREPSMKGISLFFFLLSACAHDHRDENKVVNERLRQCYVESNSYTGRTGSVQGSMTARLEVTSENKVSNCAIVKNEFKDANLTACVCDILRRSKIGNPTGRTVEVMRPVDFQAVEQ